MSAIEICHTKENYMPRNDWPNQLSSYTLSHAIILDLKGVVPTIYQNFLNY